MGKKRKAPGRPQERHAEEPDNLFERLSNKKRFNILGRKLKGETRELGKLRTAATDRVRAGEAAQHRAAACCLPPAAAWPPAAAGLAVHVCAEVHLASVPLCSARTRC